MFPKTMPMNPTKVLLQDRSKVHPSFLLLLSKAIDLQNQCFSQMFRDRSDLKSFSKCMSPLEQLISGQHLISKLLNGNQISKSQKLMIRQDLFGNTPLKV